MIRLRDTIERASRHPLLGPLVVLLLVLLLAAVFLHVAVEGAEAAAELGSLCVALATALGSLVLVRRERTVLTEPPFDLVERAPPGIAEAVRSDSPTDPRLARAFPLRR